MIAPTITTATETVRLYEDNAGLLHLYLVGDDKVICSVPGEPGKFEQDARLWGEWTPDWSNDGNITCTLDEFFEDGNPDGYAQGERKNDMVHVANYLNNAVEMVGCPGNAAQIYITGKRIDE